MKTLLMERTTSSTNSTTSNSTLNSSANPSHQHQDMSSKRHHHFHWTTNKVGNEEEEEEEEQQEEEAELSLPTSQTVSKIIEEETKAAKEEKLLDNKAVQGTTTSQARRKLQAVAISKLRSVLTVFNKNRSNLPFGLGSRVVGTLFGYRRGHVHFAFQKDPTSQPAFLIELATPISGLVREMASGLVRIALECDKEKNKEGVENNDKKEKEKKQVRLLQETLWRTYCNGKKCGYATRRECGPKDWDILKAVEPISMGAGVLPVNNNNGEGGGGGSDGGEVMYMRARFERIVGSRDSEAFYMMNPDSNGAPELSIYLLRV